MGIGSRIKKLRQNLDMTQQEFCMRIGLKRNSISLVETNKRNISDQAILSICREFNVNEDWLRNGAGEMLKQTDDSILAKLSEQYRLSENQKLLIKSFLSLTCEQREIIVAAVCKAANEIQQNNNSSNTPPFNKTIKSYQQINLPNFNPLPIIPDTPEEAARRNEMHRLVDAQIEREKRDKKAATDAQPQKSQAG